MNKSEKLKEILIENIQYFIPASASDAFDEVPDFDLRPHDYLEFAEQELNQGTVVSLINCVSYLKRAIDCQVDTFFYVYNLYNLFRKRNLKFEKKLEFLKAAGIFSTRSLSRFNTIRNKMEHDYKTPNIDDLEAYFDLVSALISILERATFSHTSVQFDVVDKQPVDELRLHGFEIIYQRQNPCIETILEYWNVEQNERASPEKIVVCAKDEINDFAFHFKLLNLLSQLWIKSSSTSYLLAQLEK